MSILRRMIRLLHLLPHLHVVQPRVLEVDPDVDLHVDADVDAHNNQVNNVYPGQCHHRLNLFQPSVDLLLSDQTPTRPIYTPLVPQYRLIGTQTQGTSPHLSPSSPYSQLHLDHEHMLNSAGPLFQVQTHWQLDLRLRHQLRQYPFVHLLRQSYLLDHLFANQLADLRLVCRLQAVQAASQLRYRPHRHRQAMNLAWI